MTIWLLFLTVGEGWYVWGGVWASPFYSVNAWKCTSFLDTRSWQKTHSLFTVATSATWTCSTGSKNELHSPLTSTLLGTISVKISNYDVLIYWNAVLQTFKQMISDFVAAPGCLDLVISYRWYFSYWLFNAKPDGSVLFLFSYVHTSSSPLVWEVWGKRAWIFVGKNTIFWHNV